MTKSFVSALAVALLVSTGMARGQTLMGAAFTYQGQLKQGGVPLNDTLCNVEFTLWTAEVGGSQVDGTQVVAVEPVNGLFTVEDLDFGSNAFNGEARWLRVRVSCPAGEPFVNLGRQELTPTPHAVRALTGIGGPDALNVDASGNVGIGTTNPTAKLDVAGSIAVTGTVDGVDVSTHAADLHAHHVPPSSLPPSGSAGGDLSGNYPSPSVDNDSHNHSDSTVADAISINNGRLYASAGSGNVGIGTTNPTAALHIIEPVLASGKAVIIEGGTDGVNPNIQFKEDGGGTVSIILKETNGNAMEFAAGGTTRMVIEQGGNVGIGKTNPSKLLHLYKDDGAGDVAIELQQGPSAGYIFTDDSQDNALAIQSAQDLIFRANGASEKMRIKANGNIGIGTTNPSRRLDVAGGIVSSGGEGGLVMVRNPGNQNANVHLSWGEDAEGLDVARIRVGGTAPGGNNGFDIQTASNRSLMRLLHTGNVGIGTNAPTGDLHLMDEGSAATFIIDAYSNGNSGGVVRMRHARGTQTSPSPLQSNDRLGELDFGGHDGGGGWDNVSASIRSQASEDWAAGEHGADLRFFTTPNRSTVARERMRIDHDGNVGIGTTSPSATLHIVENSDNFTQLQVDGGNAPLPVSLTRTGDGVLVSFSRNSTFAGSINVTGSTVTYGAFTGAHYAWTEEHIEPGWLVTLTGKNRLTNASADSEPQYGITPSTVGNDSRCAGAYLGVSDPARPPAQGNPHLIAAAGNGDMWIVDTGSNIEPGDYLISSDVEGHAMIDDSGRFPVGYIVARAAEPVDWSTITDETGGRKHKCISVFFESFVRGSLAVADMQRDLQDLRGEVAKYTAMMTALETRLAAVEVDRSEVHASAMGGVR